MIFVAQNVDRKKEMLKESPFVFTTANMEAIGKNTKKTRGLQNSMLVKGHIEAEDGEERNSMKWLEYYLLFHKERLQGLDNSTREEMEKIESDLKRRVRRKPPVYYKPFSKSDFEEHVHRLVNLKFSVVSHVKFSNSELFNDVKSISELVFRVKSIIYNSDLFDFWNEIKSKTGVDFRNLPVKKEDSTYVKMTELLSVFEHLKDKKIDIDVIIELEQKIKKHYPIFSYVNELENMMRELNDIYISYFRLTENKVKDDRLKREKIRKEETIISDKEKEDQLLTKLNAINKPNRRKKITLEMCDSIYDCFVKYLRTRERFYFFLIEGLLKIQVS